MRVVQRTRALLAENTAVAAERSSSGDEDLRCDRLLGAVLLGVYLRGRVEMLRRLDMMAAGGVRAMRGLLGRAGVIVLRSLLVVAYRVFEVLSRFSVMVCRFLRHRASFHVIVADVR
jgi:hypothetical protein